MPLTPKDWQVWFAIPERRKALMTQVPTERRAMRSVDKAVFPKNNGLELVEPTEHAEPNHC